MTAGLVEYRRKRDFKATPEPRGSPKARAQGRSFVVQRHAASRLHYDFRLELDGVLKSWAIPKGPSLDPADKRLAMQTEDHPLEYGGFEGVIPEGEYGAGTVLVWDRGTWEPLDEGRPHLERGKLSFRLHGEKLRGRWALVRIRGRDRRRSERSWLLIKDRDEEARPGHDITEERPESVLGGRSSTEIARARDRVWHSNRRAAAVPRVRGRARSVATPNPRGIEGVRRGALPAGTALQLATLVGAPPEGDEWLHEIKYDGYRIACRLARGRARLVTRNGSDWTTRFASVARALERLPVRSALLDGEVVVLLPDGTTSFNALQNALSAARPVDLVYFAFDLLHLDGYDLTQVALEERKRLLRDVLATNDGGATCRYSDHVRGGGAEFFRRACELRVEGILSKRRDAPYVAGRGRTWLKTKCIREQEFVVGGFTEPSGRRSGVGALLVGVYENGHLAYAGKVGTGFTEAVARDLRRRLDSLATSTCPFEERPPGSLHAHWSKPTLVVEVAFTEWTPDGRLRHPSFKGVREDKAASDVVREEPAALPAPRASRRRGTPAARKTRPVPGPRRAGDERAYVAGVELTHPGRILYPLLGTTKLDLARFYESIAPWIVPQLRGRPTTLVRCPDGVAGKCFYQKHVGYWAPAALRRVRIQEQRKVGEYLVVDDLPGLIGLVQIGILEIHTWNSRVEHLEQPDRLVLDLDPGPGVRWSAVVAAARLVRERLQAQGLTSFVKTTGGSGLHVVVPHAIGPRWDACARFAREFSVALADALPQAFTTNASKAQRRGRIFLDYLRNVRGATAVAAYSTRARAEAPVSTPLGWDELTAQRESAHYTVTNLRRRLGSLRADPWAGYDDVRQALPVPRGR